MPHGPSRGRRSRTTAERGREVAAPAPIGRLARMDTPVANLHESRVAWGNKWGALVSAAAARVKQEGSCK